MFIIPTRPSFVKGRFFVDIFRQIRYTVSESCRGNPSVETRRRQAVGSNPKGGKHMPITLTFHVYGITVTVTLKRDNRHSGK